MLSRSPASRRCGDRRRLPATAISKAAVRAEEAKGKNGEQLRRLAAEYETLARETRDLQTVMQADLAELRQKVDSIERMMREVA